MNYRQAIRWGEDIKEYTQNRKMPPWKPTQEHGSFRDERGLTEQEIATHRQVGRQRHEGRRPEGRSAAAAVTPTAGSSASRTSC